MPKHSRRRLQLVACLIPILVVWYYLVEKVPITFFQGTTGYFASPQRRTVTIFGNSHSSDWEQYLVFDTHSGRISAEKNATLARNGVPWPVFVTSLTKDEAPWKRWRLWELEQGDDPARNFRDFDFPTMADPRIVGHRYAVQAVAGAILVQDIFSASANTIVYPVSKQNPSWIIPVGNTNRFVSVVSNPIGPNSVSPQVAIDLYEIGESGIPNSVSSWNAMRGLDDTSSLGLTELNDEFISVHPTDNKFEIRSAVDGSLIKSLAHPTDFNAVTDKWHLNQDALYVNRGERTFSITQNRWLKVPVGFLSYFHDSPNHKLRLWSVWSIGDSSTQVVTDCDSDTEISRIDTSEMGAFLDDETILFTSMQWGLAFREVDAKTGRTIKSWRPYWWVLPSLWLSVSAYAIWSIAWLRSTTGANRWLWTDIAWISAFPILTLAYRVKAVGDTFELGRDPIFLLQGIFCALIFLASTWGCNSRDWIVRKLLPMILCLASLSTVLSLVFNARITFATNFFIDACSFATICMVVCLALRVLGFHWSPFSSDPVSERPTPSLRDLFMLVLLSAALFAPMRLIVPDPMTLDLRLISWGPLALAISAPSLAWATALTKNRYAHRFGKCLWLLLFVYLLFVLPFYFCTGSRLLRFHNQSEGFAITLASAFVMTFVLSIAFRQRRWQFRIGHPFGF